MGINNDAVKEPMNVLFGNDRANKLRNKISNKPSEERELFIIEEICQALKSYGPKYVLPFRFKNDKGNRTSHHLIFVSKHFRGYEIMKDIMANESTADEYGVPSFEYNPADFLPKQMLLFQLSRPLEILKKDLLHKYKGQMLAMKKVYEDHNVDTPYIRKNYKDILRKLYEDGVIEAKTAKGKLPRKGTFGNKVIVTFPKQEA